MSKPCIVFDLDDTLYLERDYVRSGFDAVGAWAEAALELTSFAELAWRAFQAGTRGSIFQSALALAGRTADAQIIEQMVQVYRNHCPQISMPADTLHCLKVLRTQALLAIITDGFLPTQRAKCNSLRLPGLVDLIVCTGEWGAEYYKPSPRAFRYVEANLPQPVSGYVYVADNPAKDFQAPLALGWHVIRVRRPEGLYSGLKWSGATPSCIEVQDLWSVPEIAMWHFGGAIADSRLRPRYGSRDGLVL